jgi:hypothetical protein
MVFYAYMYCVCVFSLHQESPDMILGDKPLISEVVLSKFIISARLGKTHIKASKNHNNIFDKKHLAYISATLVSLDGKLTYVLFYATMELHQRRYVMIFGMFILFCC